MSEVKGPETIAERISALGAPPPSPDEPPESQEAPPPSEPTESPPEPSEATSEPGETPPEPPEPEDVETIEVETLGELAEHFSLFYGLAEWHCRP